MKRTQLMATKNDDQIEETSSEGDGPEPSADTKSNTKGEEQENLSKEQEGKTEIAGREGLDPTRYGDWEINGRCIDF
ncbi:MAG: DUF1674 domain-containing protein [Pseudomonadota bacterium]|nr:DUF1674 domain-containing protein [Pseudomonadota bacterium]